MNNKSRIRTIVKYGVVVALSLAFVMPGSSIFDIQNPMNSYFSKYSVSVEQAQIMVHDQKAIILNIQEDETNSYSIPGTTPVTLPQLSCGSCIEKTLKKYESLIVYSGAGNLGVEAAELLRKQGYTVYELVDSKTFLEKTGFSSSLSELEFIKEIDKSLENRIPVFLFFYVDWCGFCQRQKPIIDQLKIKYAGLVDFHDINVEQNSEISSTFGVSGFPMMFFITDKNESGYVKEEFVGYTTAAILSDVLNKKSGVDISSFPQNELPSTSLKTIEIGDSEWNKGDLDGDGIPNSEDADNDNDGIPDAEDPAISTPTPVRIRQRFGSCNKDSDFDGVYDDVDNCRYMMNTLQEDINSDGIGDACEPVLGIGAQICDDQDFSSLIDVNGDGLNELCDYPAVMRFEGIMDDLLSLSIPNPDPNEYHSQIITLLEGSSSLEVEYDGEMVPANLFSYPYSISFKPNEFQYFFDKHIQAIDLMQSHGQELGVAVEYNQICQRLVELSQVLTKFWPAIIEVFSLGFVDDMDKQFFNSQIDISRLTAEEADAQFQTGNLRQAMELYVQSYTEFVQAREFLNIAKTFTVGSEGGFIYSVDGSFTMEIPPGALTDPVDFTVSIRKDQEIFWIFYDPLAEYLPPVSHIYTITPHNFEFHIPAVVTITSPYFSQIRDEEVRLVFFDEQDGTIQDQYEAEIDPETATLTTQIMRTPSNSLVGAPYSNSRDIPVVFQIDDAEDVNYAMDKCFEEGFNNGHHVCDNRVLSERIELYGELPVPYTITQEALFVTNVDLELIGTAKMLAGAGATSGAIVVAVISTLYTPIGVLVIVGDVLMGGCIVLSLIDIRGAKFYRCINKLTYIRNCNDDDFCLSQYVDDGGFQYITVDANDEVCNRRDAATTYQKYDPMRGGLDDSGIGWCTAEKMVKSDCSRLDGTQCDGSEPIGNCGTLLGKTKGTKNSLGSSEPCKPADDRYDWPDVDIFTDGSCNEYGNYPSLSYAKKFKSCTTAHRLAVYERTCDDVGEYIIYGQRIRFLGDDPIQNIIGLKWEAQISSQFISGYECTGCPQSPPSQPPSQPPTTRSTPSLIRLFSILPNTCPVNGPEGWCKTDIPPYYCPYCDGCEYV